MKTKFYKEESKVYDFLRFPERIFELVDPSKLDEIEKYKDEIDYFYGSRIYGKYSIYKCVYVNTPLENLVSIDSFLERISDLEGYELSRELLLSILVFDKLEYGLANIKDVAREVDGKIEDKDSIIEYIGNLGIESSLKWDLIFIAQNAEEVVKRYTDLLRSLQGYYESYYESIEEEVVELGSKLDQALNERWESYFNDIGNQDIKKEIEAEEEFRLMISTINKADTYWHTSSLLRHMAIGIDVVRAEGL